MNQDQQNTTCHLGGGGAELSASSAFFWPREGFFRGVFVIIPEVLDEV